MSNIATKHCLNRSSSERDQPDTIHSLSPRADVFENDKALAVVVELPGVKQSELDVTVEHQQLTVSGERTLRNGRRVRLVRRFRLTDRIDKDSIEARLEGGLLSLTLPKRVSSQPRSISVEAG
jgi:HSP20 family protein